MRLEGSLISVVIPSYKTAATLAEAIESALNQTYQPVEVIVVNDGSPDHTAEVVKPYLDRIIYIEQENRGLSAARNVGFRASKGDFLCFLDADDILLPNKFELQLSVFERQPDVGVVLSGYINVEDDGQTEISRVPKNWYDNALDFLLNHQVFPPHVPLIRRRVLEQSSLFPEDIDTLEFQEDWQLWLDMALDEVKFSSIPEPTCKYRHRSDSHGKIHALRHRKGSRRVVKWLQNDSRTKPFQDKVERLAAIVELEYLATAYRGGLFEEAGITFMDAVKRWRRFWLNPDSMLLLFRNTLDIRLQHRWLENDGVLMFERELIKKILPTLIKYAPELSETEVQNLYGGAYLTLIDLAYACNEDKIRRLYFRKFLKESIWSCLTRRGLKSFLRGLMGPKMITTTKKFIFINKGD